MPAHVSVDLPEVKGRIKGTRPESAMEEHKKMRADIGGGGADSDSDDGAEIPAMDSKAESKKRRGSLIRQRMVGDARITVFFPSAKWPDFISSLQQKYAGTLPFPRLVLQENAHSPQNGLASQPDLGMSFSTFPASSRRRRWAKSGPSTRACRKR